MLTGLLFDLDGTVYRGRETIPGAADFIAGQNAGMQTALMLTGVCDRNECTRLGIMPTWIAEDYGDLASKLFPGAG